jgi:protease PrsW
VKIVISIFPVLIFLLCLYLLDSFKLVRHGIMVSCLLWGLLSAIIAFYANTFLGNTFSLSQDSLTRYFAPFIEETAKLLLIIFLIYRKKTGFMIDAAIYGFAAGTGFALAENLFYLVHFGPETHLMVWILRGFGTSLMHGGCTAIAAMIIINGVLRDRPLLISVIPGLLAGIVIHSAFNHFWVNPVFQTAFIFVVLPLGFALVFHRGGMMLQNWMEIEFSSEVELLGMIRKGAFGKTKAGDYLISLKKYFSPEMIFDLYCFISLYLELSILAKTNLMLRETGFPPPQHEETDEKLEEWRHLRKRIGKTGELALQPLFRISHRELWKLKQIRK